MSLPSILIAFVGDGLLCWLSWRYFARPRLEAYVRKVACEEITIARRLT